MGTGSFGAGGTPVGGGGGFGIGILRNFLQISNNSTSKLKEAQKAADAVFLKLATTGKTYLRNQLCSPLLNGAYKALFPLSVEVFQNKSWKNIHKEYGIVSGPGCMREWVNKTIIQNSSKELNTKVKRVVRMTLESFIIRALDNDVDAYIDGEASTIISTMKKSVFDSTSGHFLGLVLYELLKSESEGMSDSDEEYLQQAAQKTAESMIKEFVDKFKDKKYEKLDIAQVDYSNIFDIIDAEFEWFIKKLK